MATPADQMSLPSGILKVAQYAANSQYYEAKETYIKVIVPKIDVWTKWHNLPPIGRYRLDEIQDFLRKLGMKPSMHLVEFFFSLNQVIVRHSELALQLSW